MRAEAVRVKVVCVVCGRWYLVPLELSGLCRCAVCEAEGR